MDTNRKSPRRFFERTKQRYGEMMEEYARSKPHSEHNETDFEEIERLRQASRSKAEKRRMIFRTITALFGLLFIYVFLRLAASDLSAIFY